MKADVNKIKVPSVRLRKIDKGAVEAMAESMSQRGLISSIVVNAGVLVAGAHRLAAAKLLGWDTIDTVNGGNIQVQATLDLIELDENFCRKELTAAEKLKHAARRVELVAELNLPAMIKKVAEDKVKSGAAGKNLAEKFLTTSTETDKDYPKVSMTSSEKKVIKGAKAAAKAEAIKETAKIMKTDPTNIRANIRDSKAIDDAGLDEDDLNRLNGAQVKRVVKAASESPEKAKEELKSQSSIGKNINGLQASAHTNDSKAYISKSIKYAADQISRLRGDALMRHLDLSELEKKYFADAIESLEMVVKILKAQAEDKT